MRRNKYSHHVNVFITIIVLILVIGSGIIIHSSQLMKSSTYSDNINYNRMFGNDTVKESNITSNETLKSSSAVPLAPQNLEAYPDNKAVHLKWNPPISDGGSPIEEYVIYKATQSGYENFYRTTTNTHFDDLNVTNGQRYYYQVSAVNSVGEGPKSDETSVVPSSNGKVPWPMFGRDRHNSGFSPYNSYLIDGTVKWTYTTGGYINQPAVVDSNGNIYFGSNDNKFYSLAPNGNLRWSVTLNGAPTAGALDSYGHIYIGTSEGTLYCLDINNGSQKWSYSINGSIYSSPKVGTDGTIYFGATNNYFYALTSGGGLKWRYHTRGKIYGSPAIGDDGTIYFTSYDMYVYALNPNDSLKWKYKTNMSIYGGPLIDRDGNIIVASDKVYCLYNTGHLRWTYTPEVDGIYFTPFSDYNTGTIYFGDDHYFYALYPSGFFKWKYAARNSIEGTGAVGDDGTVYFGSYDHNIYALNPNGSLRWKYSTGNVVVSNVAIGLNSTLYVGSVDHKIYCFTKNNYTVPSPPRNLVASPGNSKVILSWDPPTNDGGGTTYYYIYRGTSTGNEHYIGWEGGGTSFTDDGLTNGVTYYYYVTAVNSAGESQPSNEVSATPFNNGVFEIYSQYTGYFLTSISLENTFGAKIVRNGENPSEVWAIAGNHNYSVVNKTGSLWNLTINMGNIGMVNNIVFYAEFSDGIILSKEINIKMLWTPQWITDILTYSGSMNIITDNSGEWNNEYYIILTYPPPNFSDKLPFLGNVDLPFIGGNYSTDLPFNFEINISSTGNINLQVEVDMPEVDIGLGVADASFKSTLEATGTFEIADSTIKWVSAELGIDVSGSFSASYPLLGYGFYIGGKEVDIGVVGEFKISPSFLVKFMFGPSDNPNDDIWDHIGIALQEIYGKIKIPFTLAITGGIGIGSITGGGALELDMALQSQKPHVKGYEILGSLFVNVKALHWEHTIWQANGTIYQNGICAPRAISLDDNNWTIIARYYNTTNYNKLLWNSKNRFGEVMGNIYPNTNLGMYTTTNGDSVLMYTMDNVSKSEKIGLELGALWYNRTENKWFHIPAPPENNEIQYKPVMISYGKDKILAVWNTIPYGIMNDTQSPFNITSTVLKSGIYNIKTHSWSDIRTLSSNNVAVDYKLSSSNGNIYLLVAKSDNLLGLDSRLVLINANTGDVIWESSVIGNISKIISFNASSDMAVLKYANGTYSTIYLSSSANILSIPSINGYNIGYMTMSGNYVNVIYDSNNANTSILRIYKASGSSLLLKYEYAGLMGNITKFVIFNDKYIAYKIPGAVEFTKIGATNISVLKKWYINNITDFSAQINGNYLNMWILNDTGGNISDPIVGLQFVSQALTPESPENLIATAGDGYANITWNAPIDQGISNLTAYNVYRNGTLIATVSATQLWYNDTDVENGVAYAYYVTAVNSVGESQPSNEVEATPMTVPNAPENLEAKAGNSYVNLSWEVPGDNGGSAITGYRVYRNGSLIGTVQANQHWYNDTNVSNGVTYRYYVTAVNSVGESQPSNEVQATPKSITYTVIFHVSPSKGGTITFNGVTYKDGQSVVVLGNNYNITANAETGYKFDHWETSGGISVNNQYSQSATATVSGNGEITAVFVKAVTVPTPPQNLQVGIENGKVILTWQAPSDNGGSKIIGYKIYRGTSSGKEIYLAQVDGALTKFIDTSVSNGTTYYYYVVAINSAGASQPSNEVQVTIPQNGNNNHNTNTPNNQYLGILTNQYYMWFILLMLIIIIAVVAVSLSRRKKPEPVKEKKETQPKRISKQQDDMKTKLQKLRELRDAGLLTEQEYQQKKRLLESKNRNNNEIKDKLQKLKELKDDGLLTEEEYQQKKEELLKRFIK